MSVSACHKLALRTQQKPHNCRNIPLRQGLHDDIARSGCGCIEVFIKPDVVLRHNSRDGGCSSDCVSAGCRRCTVHGRSNCSNGPREISRAGNVTPKLFLQFLQIFRHCRPDSIIRLRQHNCSRSPSLVGSDTICKVRLHLS